MCEEVANGGAAGGEVVVVGGRDLKKEAINVLAPPPLLLEESRADVCVQPGPEAGSTTLVASDGLLLAEDISTEALRPPLKSVLVQVVVVNESGATSLTVRCCVLRMPSASLSRVVGQLGHTVASWSDTPSLPISAAGGVPSRVISSRLLPSLPNS